MASDNQVFRPKLYLSHTYHIPGHSYPSEDEARTVLFKDPVGTEQQTVHLGYQKHNNFILYRSRVRACSETCTKHINTEKARSATVGAETISFIASVCTSVRPTAWNNSAPTARIFTKFLYPSIFRKYVEKIQFSLNYDKNNRDFAWRPINIFDNISLSSP
jgi:hypothetical protein